MPPDYPRILGYFVSNEGWWQYIWKTTSGKMTGQGIRPDCLWFFHPRKEIVERIYAMLKLEGDVLNARETWSIYMLTQLDDKLVKVDKT